MERCFTSGMEWDDPSYRSQNGVGGYSASSVEGEGVDQVRVYRHESRNHAC